ncbi:unnamed protein product (macronuclear) [Paramecium tetraurelia]|uniref:Lysosomal dipeptide transporter MFSD1 n=1 Tax=Paramecium tetraurelia TaxID=5888 RepID=A0DRW9_PARTE|nr:uncharacterized protein GSPATT00019490001 [Paramecium tetraurelia]CAK85786.1 unnamed protein product [Paramecium tetraurelia]|eukprot:XP_001453183.1 hypothetical protein (macronuclear) [Paramecium tetraurelia strain d4-2]
MENKKDDGKDKTYHFLNKGHFKFRWILLGFCIWIVAGAFFCFDVPAALHNTLKQHFSDILTDGEFEIYFSGLYSIYSFANIFLPFITGRLRDAMGDRMILLQTVSFVFIGQGLFAYGVMIKSFIVMYLARIILGWGIESVQPIQTSFVSPYFKDDYLGLTIGMNTLFAGFGSVATMYFCPLLALQYGLLVATSIGCLFNLFCIVCAIVSTSIDKCAETQMLKNIDYEKVKYMQLAQEEEQPQINEQNIQQSEVSTYEQMKTYPKLFWLVAIYFGLNYSSVLGFINISVGFLTERWLGEDEESELKAGEMVAIMWLITGFFTPIFGFIADKYGGRASHCIIAGILCFVSHITLWYIYPFLSLIALGTANAIAYASPWTGVVYLVRPDYLGKAYAVVVGIYNGLFSIFPIVVGVLRAYYGSYYYSQLFLSFLGFCSLIAAILIKIEDVKQENLIDGNKIISATSIEDNCKQNADGDQI